MKLVPVILMHLLVFITIGCHADTNSQRDDQLLIPETISQDDNARKLLTGNVADLECKNHITRQYAYDGLLFQRQKQIDKLLEIAGKKDVDGSFYGTFHLAVMALGELRATQAVWLLSENLTYIYPNVVCSTEIRDYEAYFPCAESLRLIGEPAIVPMMNIISSSDDALRRRLAIWVIMEIEGKDQAVCRIDRAAAEEAAGTVKARLKTASDYIRSYKPDTNHPNLKKALEDMKSKQQEKQSLSSGVGKQ